MIGKGRGGCELYYSPIVIDISLCAKSIIKVTPRYLLVYWPNCNTGNMTINVYKRKKRRRGDDGGVCVWVHVVKYGWVMESNQIK